MIRPNKLNFCFSGTGTMSNDQFFLSKDNFSMKIEYSPLEILQ